MSISIHALLAESDHHGFLRPSRLRNFYPRSPCGERPFLVQLGCKSFLFLSTLSLRRATVVKLQCIPGRRYFYPRSPCGERHLTDLRHWQVGQISIHALLAESDVDGSKSSIEEVSFLSTLSLRRATWARGSRVTYVEISIHALLAESDPECAAVGY